MRFLTLFLLAAPAAFAESVCALDKRAIRCIKVAEVGVDDLITQAYLAESETATKSVCESLGQITCSCRGDGLAYCEAEDDNWYKFARKCKPVGERSWSHEETTSEYAHMSARTVEDGADGLWDRL
jgi:hypothetical protein